MVRRQGTGTSEVRENMRGGKGIVRLEHYWSKGEMQPRMRLCARLVIEPGASIGTHRHEQEEEVYIVVRGRGRLSDGAETTEIGPGDTVLTGHGGEHAIENIGAEPLEIIAVITTL